MLSCLQKNTLFKYSKGFTLTELLLAIALFTFGLTGVVMSFPLIYQIQDSSWEFSKAQILASDKMEKLLASPEFIDNDNEDCKELPGCRREWKVKKVDNKYSNLMVIISWQGKRTIHSISLQTLILQ